jgi:hypothetical protein
VLRNGEAQLVERTSLTLDEEVTSVTFAESTDDPQSLCVEETMFIRQQTLRGATYYRLVESYRDKGRTRQRVLISLGQASTLEEAIANEKRQVAIWEQCVEAGEGRRRRGRYVFFGDTLVTLPVGETAGPRLEKSRRRLADLEDCLGAMLKRDV